MFCLNLKRVESHFFMVMKLEMEEGAPSKVFLGKGILEICSKCTGKHLCQSVISIKLQSNFIEIALQHGCSSVNLPYIFRTPFPKNTSGGAASK